MYTGHIIPFKLHCDIKYISKKKREEVEEVVEKEMKQFLLT